MAVVIIVIVREQIVKNISSQNGTDIPILNTGVHSIDVSLSINNFYNSSNLALYENGSPISTFVSSFTNGEFSTNRISRLNDGDILKVGATITKLVLNSGISVTIFKLDE